MLPAPSTSRGSLADVVRSCLAAVSGADAAAPDPLRLPPAASAIVVLADGLGAEQLQARAGHARTLAAALDRISIIQTGVPTTTAAAIATLTAGVGPGRHGIVGYSALDPAHDRVVNQLRGWDERMRPADFQRVPTLFETASVPCTVVGPGRYADSGFTHAVLRGADYRPASSVGERLELAASVARETSGLVYVYIPELDQAGHTHGWQSTRWTDALEQLDGAVRAVLPALGHTGLLLTADHGMIDVPEHAHVLFDERPELLEGVRHIAGEPRMLHLHLEPGAEPARLAARWHELEGDRAWVATRAEAIDAGWFGPVDPVVAPRIGDVLVAARKAVAYYDSRVTIDSGRHMVGQHGSWTPAETRVPLLRFGAFAG